ncbi:MAG: LysR family transcriptional regulator [Rhizobiaceae bacterium]
MKLNSITLKQLRAFKAYIEQGSVVKAANQMNVTPPAITIQIKALEELIGASLYKHINKKARLTDTGTRVLELANALSQTIERASENLEDIRYARRGKVRLGIVSTAKYFIPSAMAKYKIAHPGIEISLFIGNRSSVMEQLENGAIDLAITGRPRGDFACASTRVCKHPYEIVAAPNNPLTKRANLTLFDLSNQEFLTREEGSGSRALMELVFANEGFSIPKIGLEADSNETIKQGVMAGLGVAFISGHTIYQEIESGRLVRLKLKNFPVVRAWYAVQNPNAISSVATTNLRDFIIQTAPNFMP